MNNAKHKLRSHDMILLHDKHFLIQHTASILGLYAYTYAVLCTNNPRFDFKYFCQYTNYVLVLKKTITPSLRVVFSSPGRRPWEFMLWRSVRTTCPSSVRPASTFSFKRLLLKNH